MVLPYIVDDVLEQIFDTIHGLNRAPTSQSPSHSLANSTAKDLIESPLIVMQGYHSPLSRLYV